MIKGLAITPPILGRIGIGRTVEKNGKRLPEKDDQFTITTQIQNREGWIAHPLDSELRAQTDNGKLRTLPVRLLFDDPDLNLRAEYTLFDRLTGRPVCAGNGETCRRHTANGVENLPCPSPNHCEFGNAGKCKAYGRLNVAMGEDDSLGSFIFRTTGFNSIRTLTARLNYYQAVSGSLLACMPLELRLRGKSTTQSHRAPIYYVDLCVREGLTLEQAIEQARTLNLQRVAGGYHQDALDQAARQGFHNAEFEEDEDETPAILEEFYPDVSALPTHTNHTQHQALPNPTRGLTEKLTAKTTIPWPTEQQRVNPLG